MQYLVVLVRDGEVQLVDDPEELTDHDQVETFLKEENGMVEALNDLCNRYTLRVHTMNTIESSGSLINMILLEQRL